MDTGNSASMYAIHQLFPDHRLEQKMNEWVSEQMKEKQQQISQQTPDPKLVLKVENPVPLGNSSMNQLFCGLARPDCRTHQMKRSCDRCFGPEWLSNGSVDQAPEF